LSFEKEYWDKFGGELEMKHFQEVISWMCEFEPSDVLVYGCGIGHRVHAFDYFGIPSIGYDISKEAIARATKKYPEIKVSNIIPTQKFDLVVCYDVLEHIDKHHVPSVLKEIYKHARHIVLFSICFMGDPNFPKDPTHITCRPKDWWEHRIREAGFEIEKVHEQFFYKEQLIIGRKK